MKYVFGLLLFLVALTASAGNVSFSWTFDTSATATCADGSPAATNCPVTSFVLQQEINSVWTALTPSLSPTLRAHTLQNVPGGRKCYRMVSNANGTLSVPSNAVCVDVPASSPKAPLITISVAIGSPNP